MDLKTGDKVKLTKKAANFVKEFPKGHEFTVTGIVARGDRINIADKDGERLLGLPIDIAVKAEN